MTEAVVSEHREYLRIARAVGHEAAELLCEAQQEIGVIRTKSNERDLVTEWDTHTEELILARLAEFTPGIAVLAEETGKHGDTEAELCWVIDPIDGTVNFAHGIPLFCVCISLEVAGQPVAAVVEAPAMGWTFSASLGGGAHIRVSERELAMQVSQTTELAKSMLASGFPYDRAATSHNFAQWEHFQRKAGACRRFGAASLDLCMVARGWLDGYWETRLSPWDLSAGALIVREAGGCVTGITGDTFSSRSGHAIASNGGIHKEILAELAIVGTPKL
ncbi:MAG: inositol monophosphatase [Myxococcales bacterium]|nr:inositol monophosphatase [Myxococcales bacterium]